MKTSANPHIEKKVLLPNGQTIKKSMHLIKPITEER